ncbi:MAG: tetratricopeptide repeat protein [Nostocales cyanobacterium W4_Combined_metabat2_030]|nr:tetratricopeptide repeat protein [Nostocales cyanobacterium W4_Combined_metabat2_030]
MDDSLAIFYLSLLLVLLAGAAWFVFRQILKTRKIESSLSRLQKKLNSEKGTAQEYYELGSIYLDKKLFSQAAVQFQKALKSKDLEGEGNLALIYNALGYACAAQEQYDMAIRHYKEALKNQPDYVTALNNLGFAYERKKLTSAALEVYEEALKLEPNNQTAKKRATSLRKQFVPST